MENTDVTGLIGALGRAGVREASRAILLGNGATARSALVALVKFMCRFFVKSQRTENDLFHKNCSLNVSDSMLPSVLSMSRSCNS